MQTIRLPRIQFQIKLIPDTFVLQNKKFLLAIIDDFHVIHTPQDPKDATTSVALHMAKEIVDVHDSLTAIPLPTDPLKIHQSAFVGQRLCRGGIHLPNILEISITRQQLTFCPLTWEAYHSHSDSLTWNEKIKLNAYKFKIHAILDLLMQI